MKKLTLIIIATIILLYLGFSALNNKTNPSSQNTNSEENLSKSVIFRQTPEGYIEVRDTEFVFNFNGTEKLINGKLYFGIENFTLPQSFNNVGGSNYTHRHILNVNNKRTPKEIIESINNEVFKVSQEQWGSYSVVMWQRGGLCGERFLEIIGSTKNIQMYGTACENYEEYKANNDFTLFKKSIVYPAVN